jgi:hypothetical protein
MGKARGLDSFFFTSFAHSRRQDDVVVVTGERGPVPSMKSTSLGPTFLRISRAS